MAIATASSPLRSAAISLLDRLYRSTSACVGAGGRSRMPATWVLADQSRVTELAGQVYFQAFYSYAGLFEADYYLAVVSLYGQRISAGTSLRRCNLLYCLSLQGSQRLIQFS